MLYKSTAPGKIILFGEHAVVHGQPAIAVPLPSVRVSAEAERAGRGGGVTIIAPDIDVTMHVVGADETETFYNALAYPVIVALRALAVPMPDVCITVRSTIPMASGLGSGAAVATALIRVIAAVVERSLTNAELNPLVYEVEQRHHGTPSGVDNTVIVHERPVYFVRGEDGATIDMFDITRPFTLLVGDSGIGSPTHLAVADVRALYQAEPARIGAIFARIGDIVRTARAIIGSPVNPKNATIELLGSLMDENHALLRELTVSSPELDRLCTAAREAGALGAKLSGGGRGGNMITLVTPERAVAVKAALEAAGAVRVIETVVGLHPD